ncbi:MAG: transglycosylase domain-containing protein [Haliscomenobacter sp.]|nr:transglycosylase domain-containing protein [Haliscomenobacter sp.]
MRQLIDFLLGGTDDPQYVSIIKWLWRIVFGGLAAVLFLFFALSFTNLPSVQQLENPKSELATEVYAASGEVLGRYYTENRVPVQFDELSPYLIQALIATEDVRFYQHSGIDFKALGRVLFKTVLLQRESSGGASTITQQLAKLLFTGKRASNKFVRVLQKFKEWIIAVRLERKYTKDEILSLYLNKYDFINGAQGIKLASEIYFNKSQDSLQIQEAATLIGMLKNSSLYNPLRRPELVLKRREVVLKQMVNAGAISSAEYDGLRQEPLGIRFSPRTFLDGYATYFRSELAKDIKDILSREENLKSDGTMYDIYRDGLRVYTTIDAEMQRIAESVMLEHMAKTQEIFFKEWKALDPWKYRTRSDHEVPLSTREQELQRVIRETERYQVLRERYLGPILSVLQNEFSDVTWSANDREIQLTMRENANPGYLDSLEKARVLTSRTASRLRRVERSSILPQLKTTWDRLQEETMREFRTPVSMRVFAYNEDMEKDTVMSPLDSIKYHRMFLQTGILAVDPRTGYIKAWVGGVNYKYFKYDHVRTNRQVGSSFKPFVYATAIAQQGISPCFKVWDMPQTIEVGEGSFGLITPWTPQNFGESYSNRQVTLFEGLKNSKNTVSVYLMKQLGDTEPVRALIHEMGIDSSARYPNGRLKVPQSPSICLGSTDLTVMEMTGAYTTFANNGTYCRPNTILRIEDKNGRIIYEGIAEEKRALQPNANYVMVDMLRYAAGVGGVRSEVGGKTGTTNDNVDGWFMGITPSLVVGTWVGGEDRWITFRSSGMGQGARMAKPFFVEFLKRIERSSLVDYDPEARFFRPPGDLGIELDCSKYQGAAPSMEGQFDEEESMFGDEIRKDPSIRQN